MKRDLLNLQVSQLAWPNLLGFEVFDYEVSIVIDGKLSTGRGVDEIESLALDKAIGEAFERSLAERLPVERRGGGFAVHPERELAIKAARLELIERDSFYCHFLTSTPFKKIENWQEQAIARPLVRLCRERGLLLNAVSLATPIGVNCVLVTAQGREAKFKRFGLRLGFGCTDTTIEAALKKAILEVMPNLSAAVLNDQHDSLSMTEFAKLKDVEPIHHQRWALNEEAGSSLDHCLPRDQNTVAGQPLDLSRLEIREENAESYWPGGLPLIAVAAHHPSAIRNFTGSNAAAFEFVKRLEQFSGKAFADIKIPLNPHPLG